MKYDVITMGETMLRLSPANKRRLEQLTSLDVEIGGSESNTAVGLSRLGLRTAWVSRLPKNALGRLIAGTIAHFNVDTSHIIWADEGRVGLYFLDPGVHPRSTQVIYDRADSAMSQIVPDEIPAQLFQPEMARLFHTSGICLAIGEEARKTTYQAINMAKAANMLISFDVNHRSLLWGPEAARPACEPVLRQADLIFVAFRDACLYDGYGINEDPIKLLKNWGSQYPQAAIVFTLGRKGSIATAPGGAIYQQPVFDAVEVDRFGGGDAFAAGFIFQWLADPADVQLALRWGAATAAQKYTIPGDLPLFDLDTVKKMLEADSDQGLIR